LEYWKNGRLGKTGRAEYRNDVIRIAVLKVRKSVKISQEKEEWGRQGGWREKT